MRVEFVNEQGFSLGVCETPAIIERYRNTQGMFEVPLCTEAFNRKKWDFQNEIWIEGATPEEIAEANKPVVPESISRMNLKIQLLLRNIEIQEIEDTINSIPEFMFPEVAKKISIIKFNEAVTFDRYNADLNLIATLMGLSQKDLDEIFINGNI
jgi:hypothetical protein